MSTRSVIARKDGSGFRGVYHHWDGYPSGLGSTLFELRNGHFKGNTEAMLVFLIDDHPQGWSTINGADFSLPSGTRKDDNAALCRVCLRPIWAHYKQYYTETNPHWVKAGKPKLPVEVPDNVFALFDHTGLPMDLPHGPECFSIKEGASFMTDKNASASGCEYAYVFDGDTMIVMSNYCQNRDKMIGAFGCGDPESEWLAIASVDLNGKEPNWKGDSPNWVDAARAAIAKAEGL